MFKLKFLIDFVLYVATGTAPQLGVAAIQWMKISEKLTSDMVFSTGLYTNTCVQMLRIYVNYIVRMVKSCVYEHQIKLEAHFLCENIIRSGN